MLTQSSGLTHCNIIPDDRGTFKFIALDTYYIILHEEEMKTYYPAIVTETTDSVYIVKYRHNVSRASCAEIYGIPIEAYVCLDITEEDNVLKIMEHGNLEAMISFLVKFNVTIEVETQPSHVNEYKNISFDITGTVGSNLSMKLIHDNGHRNNVIFSKIKKMILNPYKIQKLECAILADVVSSVIKINGEAMGPLKIKRYYKATNGYIARLKDAYQYGPTIGGIYHLADTLMYVNLPDYDNPNPSYIISFLQQAMHAHSCILIIFMCRASIFVVRLNKKLVIRLTSKIANCRFDDLVKYLEEIETMSTSEWVNKLNNLTLRNVGINDLSSGIMHVNAVLVEDVIQRGGLVFGVNYAVDDNNSNFAYFPTDYYDTILYNTYCTGARSSL